MIKSILGLREIPKPDDAADAMAVAVCHIHAAPMRGLG
jgi:crossover junction endodeoxyribonuclease RuvC